ncbi:MAG TPA: PAS domain-containing protein [Gemmataceae bacterium]|nr:PAS domain-containing protein [Gemmataceae bacterium]
MEWRSFVEAILVPIVAAVIAYILRDMRRMAREHQKCHDSLALEAAARIRAHAAIKELQAIVKRMADELGHAFVRTDHEGNITYWDRQAEKLFGWTEAEITGKPMTWLMPETDRPMHRAKYRFAATERKQFDRVILGEAMCKDRDRFEIVIRIKGVPENGTGWFAEAEIWRPVRFSELGVHDTLLAPPK